MRVLVADWEQLEQVDNAPPFLPLSKGRAQFILLEDSEPVIKMIIKERAPTMRHLPRTHRVDLDWLIECIGRRDELL